MIQYHELLRRILADGEQKSDRTGTGTLSVFGHQMRIPISETAFPLLTTKHTSLRLTLIELLWFISGSTDVRKLQQQGCEIWSEWANEKGQLGPIYGHVWRHWEQDGLREVDQLQQVIEQLRQDPDGRRHVVSAWNPSLLPLPGLKPWANPELGRQALAPCHTLFQFYVSNDKRLSCQLYQRSADVFLGLPMNIASYAALTMMIAKLLGYGYGDLIWTGGDCHLYSNHLEQARELHRRFTAGEAPPLPTLLINPLQREIGRIDDYQMTDFVLESYWPLPALKGQVAV